MTGSSAVLDANGHPEMRFIVDAKTGHNNKLFYKNTHKVLQDVHKITVCSNTQYILKQDTVQRNPLLSPQFPHAYFIRVM